MTPHPGAARLQRLALGELSAAEAEELAAHAAGCARCAARLAAERRVDEAVLASAAVPDPGAAERALARLWAQVDGAARPRVGGDAPPSAGGDGPRLAHTPWRAAAALAAAAALLLWALWPQGATDAGRSRDAPSPETAQPGLRPAPAGEARAHPGALAGRPPAVELAPALDRERLAATRERVVAVLGAAPLGASPLAAGAGPSTAAAEQVQAALAPLRAEGWPVDAHLRRLVLGDDPALAERALAHVAAAGGAPTLLAEALRAGVGGDALLDALPAGRLGLGASPALLDGLAARAGHDARARALLLAEPSEAVHAALAGVLARALDGSPPREHLAALARELPRALVLPALVDAGDARDPALAAWAREAFLDAARAEPAAAADALRPALADAGAQDPRLEWPVDARLDALVPLLAARLDGDGTAASARARLLRLGTPAALTALFVHAAEDVRGTADPAPLLARLGAEPELARAVGARVAGAHDAALRAFAEELPTAAAEALLLGALSAHPVGADPGGRRAALLASLGRLGTGAAGDALLAQLDALPADDPLLPLAWATAARLARDAALQRWRAGGGDDALLAQVAREVGERVDRALPPSERSLRPLARALPRGDR